jgi:hypothetical protein
MGPAGAVAPSAPVWEPDTIGNPAPYASLTFYDATGNVVTGGSNLTDLFAYAVGDSPFNTSGSNHATKAELSFGTPNHSGDTSTWFASSLSSGTAFPVASGPANLMSDTTTPVYTSDGSGGAGSDLIDNLGTNDGTSGFSHLAQVRLYDTGFQNGTSSAPSYWEADVAYNTGTTAASVVVNANTSYAVMVPAGSWMQVFPFVTSTTTTLTSSLTSPQPSGTNIPLTATIAPAESGTVQFFDGTTALGNPVTVGGGVADFTDSRPPGTGSHTYEAVFDPTAGAQTNPNTATGTIIGGSTSNTLPMTINAAASPTTTTLGSSANPSVFGQSVTFTASVTVTSGSAPVTSGMVTFMDGATAICSNVAVDASTGQAQCAETPALGANTITANYTGNSEFADSTGGLSSSQQVNADGTATSVQSSANPGGQSQTVTFTATVAANSPGSGTPGGTVDFQSNGTDITSPNGCTAVALSAGRATCSTTFASGGNDAITAVYTPDASGDFTSSTGTLTNGETIYPATSTTVTSSSTNNTSVFGEPVTYTATVTSGSTVTGGAVAFTDNGTTIGGCGSVSVTNGTATCGPTTPATVGPHTIVATYSPGSAHFGTSASPNFTQTVNKSDTTTVVTNSTPNPSTFGQSVTYTATVVPSGNGAGTPTGSVQFSDDNISLCTGQLSSGTATCMSGAAAQGAETITATYVGDGNFNTSSDTTGISQTVDAASTATQLTASPNPVLTNGSVTYSATVSVTGSGAGSPTGSVSFNDGSTGAISNCGAVTVTGGVATCTTAYPAAGTHSLTAVYSSNASSFTDSTSNTISEGVIAPTAPGAPTGLKAKPGDGQVTLSWTAPTSNGHSAILGYDVFVGTTAGGESATPINKSLVAGTTVTVTGLTNKTAYFFTVEAVNAVGPSVPSNEATATPAQAAGYWMLGSDGGVFGFGGAGFFGSLGGTHPAAPIVGMAHTADRAGYWLVGSDGGVFNYGDAHFYGSLGGIHLAAPIVATVPTPTGRGYWLVGADGGVFRFGDAGFYGSLGSVHLVKPIVGMIASKDGKGYLMVASDGGVFKFGDAVYAGSLGGLKLNAPIIGIIPAPDGDGYTLAASDGGIFKFGHGIYKGSLGGIKLARPIVAIIATPDTGGYWLLGNDGGVFAFNDAKYQGSLPALHAVVSNVVGGA